jgi:hypothetical protein
MKNATTVYSDRVGGSVGVRINTKYLPERKHWFGYIQNM